MTALTLERAYPLDVQDRKDNDGADFILFDLKYQWNEIFLEFLPEFYGTNSWSIK